MQQEIQNPQTQTTILVVVLFLILLITLRRKKLDDQLFPPNITQELKGFAILTIIFGHIGYFLDTQDKFLYPLSIASGVGVNIFLFLSGFGLTISTLKKKLSIPTFFRKRLFRLFLPMWIVMGVLLLLDWLILGVTYERKTILQNLLGFFPVADIYTSINSVLWYFTFILFYYLLFSVFTISRILLLVSPFAIYFISTYLLKQELPFTINKDVLKLYELHIHAFPAGIIAALIPSYMKFIPNGPKLLAKTVQFLKLHNIFINMFLLIIASYIFIYTSINSGIGEEVETEQMISMISTASIIFFFIIKRFKSKALEILGIFSYEIYLLHWPLVYRYDFLYQYLPASIATILYLIILLAIGWCLQKASDKFAKLLRI